MPSFNANWGRWVVQFRIPILITTVLLVGLAAIWLGTHPIEYDSSNEAYFVEHDPNLVAFDNLLENFGDSEYLVVGMEAKPGDADVFAADTIRAVDDITEFLEDHEYVTQVRSLSKYQYTHDDSGLLATDDLFEDIESLSESDLAHARNIIAVEPLALGTIVTEDFKHTRIAARVVYIKEKNHHNVKLVTDLGNFLDERGYAQDFKIHLSGQPFVNERFETLTKNDQAILNPAMGIVLMLILIAVFRSVVAMIIPIFIVLTTVILLSGVQSALMIPNTAVSSALLPTMIILSMGACVHVMVEFFQLRRNGLDPKQAAQTTVRDLYFPIFLTSLTTAIGFIALSITEVKPVRDFAGLAAGGAMLIFLLATTLLPAILSFIPWHAGSNKNARATADVELPDNGITHFLRVHVPNFAQKNRRGIAVIGLMITLFSLWSVSHIHADSNIANYFKKNSVVNAGLHYFNEHFKGVSNIEVVIDSGAEGGIKDPQLLQRADELQSWLESLPETGQAISVMDFYKQINQALNEDRKDFYQLPTSRPMAAQFLLLYENTGPDEDLSDLKDFNERLLRISVPVLNMDEIYVTELLNRIKKHIASNFSDLDIELTGSSVMNHALNVYVNQGMLKSFGVAILAVGICFFILFRSFKYGVVALIPSIVPVLLTGGLVSFAGVAMDLGTMVVGAMTIGLAVDDSIHVMSRYRLMRHRNYSTHDAIEFAMKSSGKAVVLTSIILVSGFSVMLFGNFVSYIYVGLFSAMIMTFALLGDLIFMPALLYIFDDVKSAQPVATAAVGNRESKEVSEHA